MNPYISLKINSHVPSINFHPNDEMIKRITLNDENISSFILEYGEKWNLTEDSLSEIEQLNHLLEVASQAIGDVELEDVKFSNKDLEFNFIETLKNASDSIKTDDDKYFGIEISEDLKNELKHNSDIEAFSAIIDVLFNAIIGKVILAAYELEITKVVFQSDFNYPRLVEKLGYELQKLDFEFEIQE